MSKQKYVVVDWGSCGLNVESSLKIIVPDPFNVNEGDECSLQGTDPTTKRPMLFKGKILAVFDTKKEAKDKVTELVTPQEVEERNLEGTRPRREPKPSKKKLASLEDADESSEKMKSEVHVSQKQKNAKRSNAEIAAGKEEKLPQRKKQKKLRKAEEKNDDNHTEHVQEQLVSQKQKSKRKADADNNDKEIVAAANAKRVQNLLMRRQQFTESDGKDTGETKIIEIDVHGEASGSNANLTSTQAKQSLSVTNSTPPFHHPSGENFGSAHGQQPLSVANSLLAPALHPSDSGSNINLTVQQHQQHPVVTNSSPLLIQSSDRNISSPQNSTVTSRSPLQQSCHGNFRTPQHWALNVTNSTSPSFLQSSDKQHSTAHRASDRRDTYSSSPEVPQQTTLRPSGLTYCDPATPHQQFSYLQSLHHCSDFDVSDLDMAVSSNYLETGNHIAREGVQQREPSFSNLPTACSGCQPLLLSLNKRLCSLEAEVEKLKRKKKQGKVVIDNDDRLKEETNEERFNGLTKETLARSVEDASDAKSAVEALARQLFTFDELQKSSVTGFQCNKDYESRPGLSPSRRGILESLVLKKGFPTASRSSVRKDLGLVLKKARASKESRDKCHTQEKKKL